MAANKLMSNLPIYIGSAGWLACAFAAVVQNPARGSRGVGITVFALWVVSGVGSGRSDVLVVDILKQYFQRCDNNLQMLLSTMCSEHAKLLESVLASVP